jgi:hypothetical protein
METAVAFKNVTIIPVDSERILEGQTVVVAQDYEAFKTTRTVVKIAFRVVVILSLVVVVWLATRRGRARRRKASQAPV